MKLCPQCDFIYEDDQSVCDMDGKELVSDSAPVVARQDLAAALKPTSNSVPDVSPMPLARRRWRSFAVATVLGFALAALIIVIYLARTHQLSSLFTPGKTARSARQIPPQSIPKAPTEPPSSADLVETKTPPSDAERSAGSLEQPDPSTLGSSDQSSSESLAHTRLTPGPVTAGTASGNMRGPVIVRLTNGAAIRADEAWEKREGVWYRQGGVVTFLKRSEVRTIERLPINTARLKSANNTAEKSRQPEPVPEPKKDSKVASFLKKTGRILKKPFKL